MIFNNLVESSSSFSKSKDTNKVSKIIAVFRNKILILQNNNGSYELPGGHIHVNESPISGARREFKEETGINIFNLQQIAANNKRILYKGVINTDNIRLSTEHKKYRLITPKNIFKFPLNSHTRRDLFFLKPKTKPSMDLSEDEI